MSTTIVPATTDHGSNGDASDADQLSLGDTVLTSYGAGVVTELDPSAPLFCKVRLWRMPHRSIASSAVAYLRRDCIVRHLPAAPGTTTTMTTTTDDAAEEENTKEVMVHCYSAQADMFLVSGVAAPTAEKADATISAPLPLMTVTPSRLAGSKASKFYPLLEDLMSRADQAIAATTSLVSKSADALLPELVNKGSEMLEGTESGLVTQVEQLDKAVKSAMPETADVMQLYNLLKDEELTVLLKKGQERLRQLVDDEIPKATEVALEKSGIRITLHTHVQTNNGNTDDSAFALSRAAITAHRENALKALDGLLKDHTELSDVASLKSTLGDKFSTVFDSLSDAARSDHTLSSIFDTVSLKTSEWQEATGRLKNTKAAGLFLESTQRLQARAATLLSSQREQFAKLQGRASSNSSSSLDDITKAFTEGDAAVARLKGIELGDAVRARLVKSIELRSGSEGGLDGIIAGALTQFQEKTSSVDVRSVLGELQAHASAGTKNAHETLLTTLSRQSQFRETALLRIESTLLTLESQLGDSLSPEDIARLSRGEGGTSALFEPIAKRAAQEIERQLDNVESHLIDGTGGANTESSLAILSKTRRIISGELTLQNLLDEAVVALNDDRVVAYGENLVRHGESVLDALENAQTNSAVSNSNNNPNMMDDVRRVVEKAGLTKSTVMKHMEKLDITTIMDKAETAVNDEKARKEMLGTAADAALDFLLKILPSMPVPDFDGVRDGLLYTLSNLSMEGFKVRKEDILVEIAGIRASKDGRPEPSPNDLNINTHIGELFDNDVGGERKEAATEDADDLLVDFGDKEDPDAVDTKKVVQATELLIIDVKNVSAVLEGAEWKFEQTYFPYMKGSGRATIKLAHGSIRLQFELRKRRVKNADDEEVWEPALCLHERSVEIGRVDLKLLGEGKTIWVLNKLASYMKGPLRDYVVRTIVNLLGNQSGMLLKKLNDNLRSFWGVILSTAGLLLDDLEELTESDLIDVEPDPYYNDIELVWREHLPLGLNILMNDESGQLKVVDFPRGSQARKVAEGQKLDPDVFKGSTITSVNGTRYNDESQRELVVALRDPGRPKAVSFALADEKDAERIKALIADMDMPGMVSSEGDGPKTEKKVNATPFALQKLDIVNEGPIGIQFSISPDNMSLRVEGFSKGEDGETLVAEKDENVSVGDMLHSVNGTCVFGDNGREEALKMFESDASKRPLSLVFSKPYLHPVSLEIDEDDSDGVHGNNKSPADELCFDEKNLDVDSGIGGHEIFLKEYIDVPSAVESNGVFLGDHLVFLNGEPVGAALRLMKNDETPVDRTALTNVLTKLKSNATYPAALTFARPNSDKSRWNSSKFKLETAKTINVAVDSFLDLGCRFEEGATPGDITVSAFFAVQGKFQKAMTSPDDHANDYIGMSVESVNGQIVPSFATPNMITNAIRKSWANNGKIEFLFCDVKRRKWLSSDNIEK